MTAVDAFRLQAAYNQWINDRLYEVCARFSDAQRKGDMKVFFRSIHGTFNHLLLVDRLWLSRLAALPLPTAVSSLGQELYADFEELRRQKDITDAELVAFVQALDSERLTDVITYNSLHTGKTHSLPLGLILTHLFHHQTHHRGQITALISQLGGDFGDTDLIFMPGAESFL